jgi:3-methyladenine DNA glycosylase AlkD
MIGEIKRELKKLANPERARLSLRYFKTGKGQYGEGDKFLGTGMLNQRKIAKKYSDKISTQETLRLLKSKFHEERMTALLILMLKYKKGTVAEQRKIFSAYLANTKFINNWDLVDVTCRGIVGAYLFDRNKSILYKLAKSKSLWEKRIAIISTFYFISKGDLDDTFKIAKMLLADKHDLIHKAVSWALREAGKHDKAKLVKFLEENAVKMPRTALRYAIEKFPKNEKNAIMKL